MDWIDGVLSGLGLKFKVVAAGAIGAFVSLRFFDGLKFGERWVTFLGGWALAAYLAEPVAKYFELSGGAMETGIALVTGLFGMSIAAAVIKVIRDTDWSGIWLSIFNKKGGN